MTNLDNSVVVVVGGGSGIGLGIGRAFLEAGARVVLAGRTAATLEGAGDGFATQTCDATDRAQVADLVAWTEEHVGPIDTLVYSAGTNVPQRAFADVEPGAFDAVLDVNAVGAFNCMHAVLPGMRARGQGLIINVVSLAGLRNMALAGVPYCASKFAQASIGTMANLEALPDGVRVTNLFPGETETPVLERRAEPPSAERRAQMLQPSDVAAVALLVARLPSRATVPEVVITPRHMPLT